ncbi:hypothetical protein LCGC14_1307110 [marine sediment metagenome]|uniref:Uncharacterized protein n=1 Tax=marine sediment metagenome TaxID=412755 RepID=A0A0F9NQX5_9ZZZZ
MQKNITVLCGRFSSKQCEDAGSNPADPMDALLRGNTKPQGKE